MGKNYSGSDLGSDFKSFFRKETNELIDVELFLGDETEYEI